MKTRLHSLYLVLTLAWATHADVDSGPVVTLKEGKIQGQYVKVKGLDRVVEQFLGIPYAQPPVGPLRLMPPKPLEAWEGVKDGTQLPNMCIQDKAIVENVAETLGVEHPVTEVSEDCLYLNVFAPSKQTAAEKLPVMFWIHGGGLYMGASNEYDGSVLAAYENIVVVVIQYRLGILGYLSTGDKHAQGNWGFLDQLAALKWVQENIESFGGDPNSVTIAGESAGAISASMLTLSPLAKGLFHRAIFQSGAATLGAYSTKQPMVFAKMVANVTECDPDDTEQLIKCIREKTSEEILNATNKQKIFIGATVDGEFLKDLAEDILKSKDFLKVPVLVGVTNHEFGWILPMEFAPKGWEKGMERPDILKMVQRFFPFKASGENELIVDEYLKDAKTPEERRDAFTEILGDMFMVLPVLKVARYHRDAGVPVYLYEFQHRPSIYKDSRPSFVKADHADEVGFVFGACFWNGYLKVKGNVTEEEKQLCKTVMRYWGNFIRTGSPNGEGVMEWPRFDQSNKYMMLNVQPSEGTDLKIERLKFFDEILPTKVEDQKKSS
ncbi:carboxylesterase 3 isoform X2 [Chanos chanos]|uniref:Carboxylic ester hydrolase n=1 Tax=Chanos chanos TaxID=29144 RepID=A0A6J2WRR2_CHACN|nr:carboxylesterase 5A-like isoform X2 [Chanos chanos]